MIGLKLFDRSIIRIVATTTISVAICAFGLWVSTRTGNPNDAARAGAVIVAATLFLAIRSGGISDSLDQFASNRQIDEQNLETLIRAEKTERTLVFALPTFIGTLFWGFGDLLAKFFV